MFILKKSKLIRITQYNRISLTSFAGKTSERERDQESERERGIQVGYNALK